MKRTPMPRRTTELRRRTPLEPGGRLERRTREQAIKDLRDIPMQTCCGKRRFATREAAEAEMTRLSLTDRGKRPANVYKCGNDWWHLTAVSRTTQMSIAAYRARAKSTELQRTTLLRPVSPKRAAANRERRAMVAGLYPEPPLCTVYTLADGGADSIPAAVLDACRRWAEDLHEPLTRGRGGSITDEDNQTPLCRPCHDTVTFTPESQLGWVYELGLLKHSWDAAAGLERGAA